MELMSITHMTGEDLEPSNLSGLLKVKGRNLFVTNNTNYEGTLNIYEFDGEDLCETGCSALINW